MKLCRLLMTSILVLAVAGFAGAATQDISPGPSKSFEPPAVEFDRVEHFRRMAQVQTRLTGSMVDLALASPLDLIITPEERLSISEGESAAERKMKVGLVKELDVPISFDRHALSQNRAQIHESLGAVRGGFRGRFDWTANVRAPEATALRIHFTDFDLPAGSELYVYSLDGVAFGPYTGKGPNGNGEFWTNTVPGSDILVQLHAGAAGDPSFRIAGAGYLTSEFAIASSIGPPSEVSALVKNCSYNASCVEGAGCPSSNGVSAVSTARNAVAHILFASGRWLYICSGGLVADSDTSTSIPYFITANHCISKGGEAGSMETFFNYTSTCGGCPNPGAASTTGSSIVSTNRTSDYTLLRLSQQAPGGAAFLGWESTPVANSNNTPLYRISHPQGAPQSYSTHTVDTAKTTCQSWPRGNWIYSRDTFGATEGGSSGSPVVNGAGKLVGQLSGACGFNVNNVCDASSNATVDGAFAAYYNSVSSFLGPGGGGGDPDPDPPCVDNDGDGYCVEDGDCNDNDPNIHPGHPDKGKWGRDGKDNDCNGIIDG